MAGRNPLEPTASELTKIGSIVRHVEEGLEENGHPLDVIAVRALLADEDVVDWLGRMDELGLLPVKR